ncbi:DsrE family protein [Massilia solisilvae]|uniref:DsrE family protein n=1 Tax=Massilia solisilvae TaxID=1811225 RepID=A0ABT2BHI8_9BURK|nr:DsrE family protein [Massilia solisilvae]MCS0607979.1 DsrE family protein [Massilia solisilvae]
MTKPSQERRSLVTQSIAAAAAAALCAGAVAAEPARAGGPYKVVIQVSDADPHKWNLTLNNARNAAADLGKDTVIEIVVFGPGIGMLKAGSEVGARITEAAAAGIKLVACQNTMRALHLEPKDMLPEAGYVPSGVGELIRRQHEGYAYLRS